ncbi:MAG: methionyl-tRNA formyltransferase, partial [Candidatus Saccharibacteria bacterium]
MKIVFAGTTRFGIPALELILKSEHELLAVITQPDRPVGRKQTLTETPIKTWALKRQIKTLAPEKIQDAAAEIRNLSPDVMVVAAYGQIIPADVLEIPKFGSFNLHASILPKYRGASPIQAALIEGEKETGVTLILMDEKMDHGPMAGFAKTEIDPKDTFDSLYDKLANAAAGLLLERLPQIEDKSLKLIAQNHEQATFTRMIRRQDARINWTEDAAKIA